MAWLTTPSIWYRRKPKLVIGSTAGDQIDYQLKLTIYKGSGTDTDNTIYLGGYVNNDFSDLRFTSSDGITLLPYWIESYISGTSAIVWIKIDSIPADPFTKTIYIYYDNPVASPGSNGTNTFVVYNGLDTFTEVDPASKYTITPTKITVTGAVTGETSGTHKTISTLTDFIAEFEYLSTGWSYPAVYVPFMFGDAYINSNYAANIGTYNGIGMEMVSTAISTLSIYTVKWVNGARTEGTYYTIPSGTNFYIRVTRIGTTYTLNVFSNPQRTTNYGGSPTSVTVANTSWNILGLAVNDLWVPGGWAGRYQSYYVQNVIIRKYASPEPTFGTTGIEELSGAPTCTTTTKNIGDILTLQATPVQGVAPYTVEFRRANSESMVNIIDTTNVNSETYLIPIERLGGLSNPVTSVTEGTVTTRLYTIDVTDINNATSKAPGEGASLLFASKMVDSCTPIQTCVKYCKVFVVCSVPVCDFTVM